MPALRCSCRAIDEPLDSVLVGIGSSSSSYLLPPSSPPSSLTRRPEAATLVTAVEISGEKDTGPTGTLAGLDQLVGVETLHFDEQAGTVNPETVETSFRQLSGPVAFASAYGVIEGGGCDYISEFHCDGDVLETFPQLGDVSGSLLDREPGGAQGGVSSVAINFAAHEVHKFTPLGAKAEPSAMPDNGIKETPMDSADLIVDYEGPHGGVSANTSSNDFDEGMQAYIRSTGILGTSNLETGMPQHGHVRAGPGLPEDISVTASRGTPGMGQHEPSGIEPLIDLVTCLSGAANDSGHREGSGSHLDQEVPAVSDVDGEREPPNKSPPELQPTLRPPTGPQWECMEEPEPQFEGEPMPQDIPNTLQNILPLRFATDFSGMDMFSLVMSQWRDALDLQHSSASENGGLLASSLQPTTPLLRSASTTMC